jgi:hypothetical protein
MAKKVLYIKIARIDQNGNDLTNTLESLTQITIPLTTSGNKTYKILTRADFPTYYLFQVDLPISPDASTNPNTSVTTLDYDFSGSLDDFTTGSGNVIGQFPLLTGTGPQIFTDFYNSEQQRLEINTMPKKDLFVSLGSTTPGQPFEATVAPGGTFADSASVELFKADSTFNSISQLTNSQILTRGMGATLISRSVSIPKADITPGDVVFLGVKETGSSISVDGARVSLSNDGGGKFTGKFFLTSSAAQGAELENIVEPYLVRKFTNSDCDVLINNANQYKENPFLQDLDFSSGTIVPVNYNQIVAGTAQKATVPESMFTMGGMINPNNSAINQVNEYNISGSSYFGQSSAGTFCVYYTTGSIAGSGGQSVSTFNISYVIGNDGETFEITNSDLTLDFLRRLFGSTANPIQIGGGGGQYYPEPTQHTHTRAIAFRGVSTSQPMAFNGSVLIENNGSLIQMKVANSGSGAISIPQGGGIIYPSDIELTSAFDLPDRSRKILTEANILGPENIE